MTPDVVVRRCTLTIRRRGGWSWGPDPRSNLEDALARVEAVIAAAIAEAGVDDGAPITLRDPVRIEVAGGGAAVEASRCELVARLRTELARAGPHTVGPPARELANAESAFDAQEHALASMPPPEVGTAVARTLARWARTGRLAAIAASWPPAVVRAWIEALRVAAARPGAAVGAMADDAVDRIAEALLEPRATSAPGGDHATARLLVLLGALAAALGDRLPALGAQGRARTLALGDARLPELDDEPPAPTPSTAASVPAADASRTREASDAPPRAQPDVVSALPFLVLAQLARIGYADAVGAASAAAGAWVAHGLGAALAGKVLPPPRRDWRRTSDEAAAIALAAGIPREDVPAALASLAARADEVVPPLRAALEGAYAEGRSANEELIVSETGHGIVCGEAAGLLPAAWVGSHAELDDVLESLEHPPVRRTDDFAELVAALQARRGLPRLDAPGLESHVGTAVGTALGLLALELWSEDMPTSPLLALERLADLEAQVLVSRNALEVSVPRGQRWLDLRRAGLLGAYAVVWLPGGRLELGTW